MAQPDATGAVRRQFGAVAAAYAESPVHRSGPDLEALLEAGGFGSEDRVLDLGCGAGHTALAVAPRVAEVVAADVTPEMLAVARSLTQERGLANLRLEMADATDLPFADGEFDAVTSRFSAHHFADPAVALAEAARVLRPGGRLLLVDTVAPEEPALDSFCNTFELLRDASHVRNCRVSEWLRLLAEAGFETEVVYEAPLELDAEAWVVRSQTPPGRVAALRELFAGAGQAAREAFNIRLQPWMFCQPVALFRGLLR